MKNPLSPGDHIDHYRLDAILAQSNVGILFRATDMLNNRTVAVKVPHPEVESDPTFADWFRREQETGRLLDHPGVMKAITDPAQTQSYIVMEWFDGKPLRQLLNEEKRLTPERAGHIVVNICAALEYLHSVGVIHGDLRPENILIGAADSVKLIEFGGAAKAKARRLTLARVAQLAGVSDYISPEEVLGKRIDARSDIYSLGLILYEMLTGQQPFSQRDPSDRLLTYPMPPREIDPAISPQLQEVVYRSIERKPENRYASARELAQDLEHLDQVGITDRPELRDWKKHRSAPLKKILLYSAIALIPIILLGLLFYVANSTTR